jgi:chromate reductase
VFSVRDKPSVFSVLSVRDRPSVRCYDFWTYFGNHYKMQGKRKLFIINGSASSGSSNQRLIDRLSDLLSNEFEITVYNDLKTLPHFDPRLSESDPPVPIIQLRKQIHEAYGVIICTPEYVFSIPSGLKNAIEWCVATVVFSHKPTGIITASAHGQKGHEELQLIMRTVMAKFNDDTTWLVQGIKGKVDERGQITNDITKQELTKFVDAFRQLVFSSKEQGLQS